MKRTMRVIQSETVFRGRVFNVRRDVIEEASRCYTNEIVEHALSYAIIARPGPDELILIEQYRHAAGTQLWEIPAGTADPGERPQDGALRELREETGYRGDRIQQLFTLFPTPGFCEERLSFFLVDGLHAGPTEFDEDESIQTRRFSTGEALAMFERGEIQDAKTVLALLWLDRTTRQQFRQTVDNEI